MFTFGPNDDINDPSVTAYITFDTAYLNCLDIDVTGSAFQPTIQVGVAPNATEITTFNDLLQCLQILSGWPSYPTDFFLFYWFATGVGGCWTTGELIDTCPVPDKAFPAQSFNCLDVKTEVADDQDSTSQIGFGDYFDGEPQAGARRFYDLAGFPLFLEAYKNPESTLLSWHIEVKFRSCSRSRGPQLDVDQLLSTPALPNTK